MAKIAVNPRSESRTDGAAELSAHALARGNGWTVSDVVCSSGPHSRPFEERHTSCSIALVLGGTFQYRSGSGDELMTPGSVLLGNPGQYFECAHEHGVGDRCLSVSYSPEFFEQLAADAGCHPTERWFRALRIPPVRVLSGLAADAYGALAGSTEPAWEELAIRLAARAIQLDRGGSPRSASAQPGAFRRVAQIVRMVEAHPEDDHRLDDLARTSRVSPYYFLRIFQTIVGVTPHQYVLRMRLRRSALRLSTETSRILDIALDSGFGDVSNFNRTFRAEFGVNPRAYRWRHMRRSAA